MSKSTTSRSTEYFRVDVDGIQKSILLFDNIRSFVRHADKHLFNESLWEGFLGSGFRKYIRIKTSGEVMTKMYSDMYEELVFPKLCEELRACLDEPLFVTYLRRKAKDQSVLPECKTRNCLNLIGKAGLVMAIENDVLKTAYFPEGNGSIKSTYLRIKSFSSAQWKIREGNQYLSVVGEDCEFWVLVEQVKWVLSDSWKKLGKTSESALGGGRNFTRKW